MTHLDICNKSYGQKKGQKKAPNNGYNFGSDLVLIGGSHQKL